MASGGGDHIEHALVSAVSGLDDAALTRTLRPAVAANVLTVEGDGYSFRHALIREAVHDDLLPGEHSRLHARYAEALEADPALAPAGRLAVLQKGLELNPAFSLYGYLLLQVGTLAVARGDLAAAADAMRAMPASFSADHAIPQDGLPYTRLLIEWRLATGDITAALDSVHHAVTRLDLAVRPRFSWPVLVSGMKACAEVATDADTLRDEALLLRATELRTALRALADRLPVRGRVMTAQATTFAAESARATGMLDRATWDAAAEAWEDLGHPYPFACALIRAAESAAGDGDREGAGERLRRAAELADRLGAGPLREQIGRLARRARISLADQPVETAPSLGLTPREREVLRPVAEGRTNREIADALFISVKTASVHVSNILGKLGVTGRGEAAATAHRLRLFG